MFEFLIKRLNICKKLDCILCSDQSHRRPQNCKSSTSTLQLAFSTLLSVWWTDKNQQLLPIVVPNPAFTVLAACPFNRLLCVTVSLFVAANPSTCLRRPHSFPPCCLLSRVHRPVVFFAIMARRGGYRGAYGRWDRREVGLKPENALSRVARKLSSFSHIIVPAAMACDSLFTSFRCVDL